MDVQNLVLEVALLVKYLGEARKLSAEQDAKSVSSVETDLERGFRVAENTVFSRGDAVCRRIAVLCYHRMCVYAKGYLAHKNLRIVNRKTN